jgi:hypothetical protein
MEMKNMAVDWEKVEQYIEKNKLEPDTAIDFRDAMHRKELEEQGLSYPEPTQEYISGESRCCAVCEQDYCSRCFD